MDSLEFPRFLPGPRGPGGGFDPLVSRPMLAISQSWFVMAASIASVALMV